MTCYILGFLLAVVVYALYGWGRVWVENAKAQRDKHIRDMINQHTIDAIDARLRYSWTPTSLHSIANDISNLKIAVEALQISKSRRTKS